jgi:hypothetical protein
MQNLKFCIILPLVFAAVAAGQTVTLSLESGSGAAGGAVALPLLLATAGGAQPAALEFSFSYTSDIASVSVTVGSAATAANKSVSCSGTTCVVWGMDSTAIADGSVATATFQVSSNPSANPVPIQITRVQVSDPDGNSIPASGSSGSISLPDTSAVTTLTSLNCGPSVLGSNAISTCTVSLSQAGVRYTTILLGSNNTALTVPASAALHSGQSTTTFSATTGTLNSSTTPSAVVTATLGSSSRTATLTLQVPTAGLTVASLTCAPATIASSSATTCTVTLTQTAPSYTAVTLQSNNPALAVPASAAVHSGESTTTFSATTGTLTATSTPSAIIAATLNGPSATATVILQLPKTETRTCNPSTIGDDRRLCKAVTGPAVSNVTPSSLPVGVYKISIQGSGFTPDTRVSLGGSPLATTFVSETLLTAAGYATESQLSSLVVSDGVITSAPIQIQTGVEQPRLSYAAAVRFLQQSTFGPQPESIMHLQQTGIQGWLDEQYAMQAVSNPDQPLVINAVRNPDQLRQRVGLAFGQAAISDAFGNYRQILADTRSGESAALDAVFNQPATGTVVATQLIQSLVKANPSPAYVQRVAAVFDENRFGVRGDMRSVVSAVLLDPEARAGDIPGNDASNSGRFQADTEFLPGLLRALGVSEAGLLATGPDRSQLVARMVTSIDLTTFVNLAGTPESLADALDVTFMGGGMPVPMKQTLTAAIAAETGGNLNRAQLGVYLVATSGEYNIRH